MSRSCCPELQKRVSGGAIDARKRMVTFVICSHEGRDFKSCPVRHAIVRKNRLEMIRIAILKWWR